MRKYLQESYRGHAIEVKQEKSLGGDWLVYYSVFRESDQYECDSGHSYDGNMLKHMAHLKATVDRELEKPNPWSGDE